MNDSFLEDLDLIPKNSNAKSSTQVSNKYITTRKVLSQSTNIRSKSEDSDLKRDKIISSSSSNVSKSKVISRSGSQEPRKSSDSDSKPRSSTPKSDKKKYGDENCEIPEEKEVKVDESKTKLSKKLQDVKYTKSHRHSGSPGCSSKCFDSSSSKENTRPSTDGSSSSKEGVTQHEVQKDVKYRRSDTLKKSVSLESANPIEMLNAIKDLVTKCTEKENMKILKSMQTLHINSQANLIKHLMHLKDDLVKDFNLNKSNDNMKFLIEENEKMREDIFILRSRNEILQKKIDELVLLKEENTSLKMKIKELQQ